MRVQQLASNLLANAVTHGSTRTPIEVEAFTTAESFVLRVRNDGDPIPPTHLPKVFAPFHRGNPGSQKGLGLGLFICAQIVRAHRGHLEVTSSSEDGTLFAAQFPVDSAGEPVQHGTAH